LFVSFLFTIANLVENNNFVLVDSLIDSILLLDDSNINGQIFDLTEEVDVLVAH